jgi:hypothetical protein
VVERAENCHVMSTDLLAAFNSWNATQGGLPWTERTLAERFETNDFIKADPLKDRKPVERKRIRFGSRHHGELSRPAFNSGNNPAGQYTAWTNMRFTNPSHPAYIPTEDS